MTNEYLLQDSRGNTGDRLMFWREGGGYCTSLDHAQRFSYGRAVSHNVDRETDKPWPLAYLVDRHELAVDHQYIMPDDVASALAIEEQAYLCFSGQWNGNDLLFMTESGRATADLRQAKVFTVAIAVCATDGTWLQAMPKVLTDNLARKVAPAPKVNIAEALKGTGIKLAKPPKPQRSAYRCDHCGCFISEAQRFGDCPKCEGANAP